MIGSRNFNDWDRSPPKTLWRQPIGLGWSAFAVSGQHAITQEQRREDELIVCYELQTGHALWAHTSPVYLEVSGKPVSAQGDARYFLEWIDRLASAVQERNRIPSRRKPHVQAQLDAARAVYRKLAGVD